jgi:hypothetical protein
MAKVERFEDLICWQKARGLVNLIYSVSRANALSKDMGYGINLEERPCRL